MGEGNSLPVQRTDKGRIYSHFFTIDGGLRPKYIVNKHLYFKYYTILYLRIVYTVNILYTTFLQLLYGKRLVIY